MAKSYDNIGGVWRTIGGRRVFIKNGQSLSDAMKESGKFKNTKKKDNTFKMNDEEKKKYEEVGQKIDDLTKEIDRKNAYEKYVNEKLNDDEYLKANRPNEYWQKQFRENKVKTFADEIKENNKRIAERDVKEKGYEYYSRHGLGPGTLPKDVNTGGTGEFENGWTKFKTDRPLTSDELKKYDIQPEIRNAGIKEQNKIETISKAEYDKMPNDYKGTLKELVDTAEFRGENKQDLIKQYEKMGYDVNKDKTILANEKGGTVLKPVKISNSNEKYTIDYFKEKGVEVKDGVPNGYVKLEGATTAPKGYEWYSNGKSRFGGEYKNALVKTQDSSKTTEIKVKGDTNVIPRDFEKGYGRFKVETNSNKGHLDDRYEITKDEYGDYHAKNLRTGETYATFGSHLRNNNVFEFENGKKPNDTINNTIRRKAYQKYLREHPASKITFESFKDMRNIK